MKNLGILFLIIIQVLLLSYGAKILYEGDVFFGTFNVVINSIGIGLNIKKLLNEE